MKRVENYKEYNLSYNGFIYETTCLVNGMKYIGRHGRRGTDDDPSYIGSPTNPQFWEDLERYGRENFIREIIDKGPLTFEEACIKEIEYQERVKADTNPMYYNLSIFADTKCQTGELNPMYGKTYVTNGAEEIVIDKSLLRNYEQIGYRRGRKDTISESSRLANKGKVVSQETRKKMSDAAKKRPPISEKTRDKFRARMTSKDHPLKNPESALKLSMTVRGEGNPFYNKHHTEETRSRISNSMKGENNPCYGKKMMNNGLVCKFVPISEISDYELLGWKLGKIVN